MQSTGLGSAMQMLCGWEGGPTELGKATRARSPRWRPASSVRARGDRETMTHSGLQGTGAHSCRGAGCVRGCWPGCGCVWALVRPSLAHVPRTQDTRVCTVRGGPQARLSPLGAPAVHGGRGGACLAGRITEVTGRGAHTRLHRTLPACLELEPEAASFKVKRSECQVLLNWSNR